MKRARTLLESFNYAISGIIYALKTQRNMRIHFFVALLVLFTSSFFDLSATEILLILFAIVLVIITELVNTAIESTVDLVTLDYHPLAKTAKNVAAGAVLVAAVNSVIVGYLIFFKRFEDFTRVFLFKARNTPRYVFFISLAIVIPLVIILKISHGSGTPFRGGLPSGHTAVAFAILTAVFFISSSVTFILCFIMAILVAESRVETGIHSISEVILGALLGIVVTSLIFWLFY